MTSNPTNGRFLKTACVGQKYGKLTILERLHDSGNGQYLVRCICDCGQEKITKLGNLRKGGVTSCGCICRTRFLSHGLSKHPLHAIWRGILSRCYNPNRAAFKDYGGRGVIVCDEWRSDFKAFYDWAIDKWAEGLHIDRENNDGPYSPENCRFITGKCNANNRRNSIKIEYNGVTKTITEWGETIGISCGAMRYRLQKMPLDQALTQPRKS